jgi:hypothetical protein
VKFNVSQTVLALVFGAALIAAPAILGPKGPLSYDQAVAGPGNSGDHGGGNGNGGGKDKASATEDDEVDDNPNSHGKLASKLGALNAYHASVTAFENASPNSRVGKIKAYWDALQAAEEDGIVRDEEQANLNALLDDAANKPIDDETREAFNELLKEKFADDAEAATQ